MASRLQLIRSGLTMTLAFSDFLLLEYVSCSDLWTTFKQWLRKMMNFTSKSWALSSSYTWELMAQEATKTSTEDPGSPETLDFHRLWEGMVVLRDSRRFYFDLKGERVLCGCCVCVCEEKYRDRKKLNSQWLNQSCACHPMCGWYHMLKS